MLSTCVIVKLRDGKLGVAQRTRDRMTWLKMNMYKLVVDPDFTPIGYDKDIVLVEAAMPVRGLPDDVVKAVLNHSFCSSNKLYYLQLLCPWILPVSYEFLTNKYATCCIDLTEDEDNGRVFKKHKPVITHANLSTIGPVYWGIILSFLQARFADLSTFVAVSKQLYHYRSYFLSKIPLTVPICHLHDIRDCNPYSLCITEGPCKKYFTSKSLYTCPHSNFDLQHLEIVRAMTNLRSLRLDVFSNKSLACLEQVETLCLKNWKKSKQPVMPRNLLSFEVSLKSNLTWSLFGTYPNIRSLTTTQSISTCALLSLAAQFPNLLILDIGLTFESQLPNPLPPKLQKFRESSGCKHVSLRELAQCKDLQVVDIRNLYVDLPLLETDGFPNLKVFRCASIFSKIAHVDFLGAWQMQNLIELRVQSSFLMDISAVSSLSMLQTLGLIECMKLEQISPLIGLKYLATLEMTNCYSVQDLESLAAIPSLKNIYYASDASNSSCAVSSLRKSCVNIQINENPHSPRSTFDVDLHKKIISDVKTMNEASISDQVHFFGFFFCKRA